MSQKAINVFMHQHNEPINWQNKIHTGDCLDIMCKMPGKLH